ncbi:Tropomyosin [Halotydeus destructor]|nr:Tropomyosin [Halotydeus destructor]
MEAIKKKMQAMKTEKENAVERAEAAEQQAKDANVKAEKSEEEVRALQKKIQQVENELDQVQENLGSAMSKLEEKDKSLQNFETFAKVMQPPTIEQLDQIVDTEHLLTEVPNQSNMEEEDSGNEYTGLRCSSVQTEVINERAARRRQRSQAYPGLAFGSSIFSSRAIMTFNIIANDLHNIKHVHLKRVRTILLEGENCDN